MPGPLQAAGAAPEATEYAPLTMDRYITGLYTQRSPKRDADTSYLMAKFYSATRFDSLIDGVNREVTSKLTMRRRPGHTVFNANTFPPIRTFFSYKFMQNGVQQVRTMADTDAYVYDATPPNQTQVFQKSAGAGRTRFLSIGTELFMANGVDAVKWVNSAKTWQASTMYNAGDFIVDPSGNVQFIYANSQATVNIASVAVVRSQRGGVGPYSYFLLITWTTTPAPLWADGTTVSFQGLTNFTQLNGYTLVYHPVNLLLYNLHPNANQTLFNWTGVTLVGNQPDTGNATGGTSDAGMSGTTQPTWNDFLGGTTQEFVLGNSQPSLVWTCVGPQVQAWTVAGPTTAPGIINSGNDRYWQPNTNLPNAPAALYYACYDSNGNLEVIVGNPGPGTSTGGSQPTWAPKQGGYTYDGSFQWVNCGNITSWAPNSTVNIWTAILDSNGNLQIATTVLAPGQTGNVQPGWNTLLGSTTTDNNITWTCVGPGITLAYGSVSYCYAYESIDGSVSTASPLVTIPNGVLGLAGGYTITLAGQTTPDPQCAYIDIFRTAQGGSIPVFLTRIPNPCIGQTCNWTYLDKLPDTALNPLEPAPIAHAGDPPPAGATAPAYHLQRVWMIVGSRVIWSGGPDTVFGNGNTAFPPANTIDFQELLTRLIPITTNQGAALLVIGTANSYAVLGQGTPTSPFYPASYMATVGSMQYDAICMVGSTPYMMTNNRKFISMDPSAGYIECGFPIGDQFVSMTTAGFNNQSVYSAANAYVSFYEKNSGDTALFIADGNYGFFRYSPVASPESGYLFSPFGIVVGGTSAVLSIETSTGEFDLLVGPPAAGGPILKRDSSTNADNNEIYDSSMTIGNIVLCESGEIAEVAHIALDSIRTGNRPTVGMLYNEISTTANISFDVLEWTANDPPQLDESQTLYSDRYSTLQDGVCPKCTHCQVMIDYGQQNAPDELIGHTLYGAKFGERRQAA